MVLHCSALSSNCILNNHFVCEQGGQIVLKEVNNHWSENLIPSPNKKDLIFQHIKGPGLHSYVEQPNGVKKYVCSPKATWRSNQRQFMKNTTTALYKHFLQMYPLRKVRYVHHNWTQYTVFQHSNNHSFNVLTCRYCYLLPVLEIEAVLCLQTFSSVSALPYKSHFWIKLYYMHANNVLNRSWFNTNWKAMPFLY